MDVMWYWAVGPSIQLIMGVSMHGERLNVSPVSLLSPPQPASRGGGMLWIYSTADGWVSCCNIPSCSLLISCKCNNVTQILWEPSIHPHSPPDRQDAIIQFVLGGIWGKTNLLLSKVERGFLAFSSKGGSPPLIFTFFLFGLGKWSRSWRRKLTTSSQIGTIGAKTFLR